MPRNVRLDWDLDASMSSNIWSLLPYVESFINESEMRMTQDIPWKQLWISMMTVITWANKGRSLSWSTIISPDSKFPFERWSYLHRDTYETVHGTTVQACNKLNPTEKYLSRNARDPVEICPLLTRSPDSYQRCYRNRISQSKVNELVKQMRDYRRILFY